MIWTPAIWLDLSLAPVCLVYTIPKGSFSGPLEEKQQSGVFPIPKPYTL